MRLRREGANLLPRPMHAVDHVRLNLPAVLSMRQLSLAGPSAAVRRQAAGSIRLAVCPCDDLVLRAVAARALMVEPPEEHRADLCGRALNTLQRRPLHEPRLRCRKRLQLAEQTVPLEVMPLLGLGLCRYQARHTLAGFAAVGRDQL